MVERQHGYGGGQANALGERGDAGQEGRRRGIDAERIEMVLADPDRVHAEPIGEEGFLANVQDETLGTPRIVGIMIVAQGEITELHAGPLPLGVLRQRVPAISCICNDRAPAALQAAAAFAASRRGRAPGSHGKSQLVSAAAGRTSECRPRS